jgi:hypothetical protein
MATTYRLQACKTLFTPAWKEAAIGEQMAGMMLHVHILRQQCRI